MRGLQSINSDVNGTYVLSNDLSVIGSYAFYGHSITDIYINGSIKTIQDNAFNNSSITNVYYGGYSEEYFNKINIGTGNNSFTETNRVYYTGINRITFNQNNITWASVNGVNVVLLTQNNSSVFVKMNQLTTFIFTFEVPLGFEEATIIFARFAVGTESFDLENAIAKTNSKDLIFNTTYKLINWTTME